MEKHKANIEELSEEQLRALDNLAWHESDLELQWLCQEEVMRRRRENEKGVNDDQEH